MDVLTARLREGGASESLRQVGGEASGALAGTGGGTERCGEAARDRKSCTEPKPTAWPSPRSSSHPAPRPGAAGRGEVPAVLLPRPNVHWAGGHSDTSGTATRGASRCGSPVSSEWGLQGQAASQPCGHPAAGAAPRRIHGIRAIALGRAKRNLPAASPHQAEKWTTQAPARNSRQQCYPETSTGHGGRFQGTPIWFPRRALGMGRSHQQLRRAVAQLRCPSCC